MILTNKQEEALKIILTKYKNNEKYAIISGYAGSGKSTLIKFAIEALDADSSKVAYATFTGKAAEVLRKKGNKNAITLHKLLYESFPRPGGGFFHKPKQYLEYSIVVVDEISLAPKSMIDLLLTHHVFCIFLGDPFQLPPIDKDEDNHLLDNPHIFLDEIMRQAQESEIIRLSMDIRARKPLEIFYGNEVQIVDQKDVVTGMLTWADQVLVATNLTRQYYNNEMRKLLGFGEEPEEGDKVVCLRNYWDISSDNGDALVNGTIGYLVEPKTIEVKFPRYLPLTKYKIDTLSCGVTADGDLYPGLRIDKEKLLSGADTLDWRDTYKLNKMKNRIGDLVPKEFAYGYAITCHKAQGSQWPKIFVVEEKFPFNKEEHARWLYTALTRAEEKAVIVRSN